MAGRSEEDAEEELCCCALVRGGRKVVCGASEGAGSRGAALNIFSTGYWNGPSDRLPGAPLLCAKHPYARLDGVPPQPNAT